MVYYYPNRPLLLSIDNPKIDEFDKPGSGWWAERKMNGTRLCLHRIGGKYFFWNRHKKLLKYDPPKSLLDELNSLPISGDFHLDAELMHFKTKNIKHAIYFYDVYFYSGERARGPLEQRKNWLWKLLDGKRFEHLTLANEFKRDFRKVFADVTKADEVEGLVFKHKDGKIQWDTMKSPDVWWQVKVRKQNNSYRF